MNADDPIAREIVAAIRTGDVDALGRLVVRSPLLARASIESGAEARSLLHIATDWPGHFPRVAESIALLATAGADPNARFLGRHTETPLHWAASSNDVAAIDALLAHGAEIDSKGGIIGEGTPLLDATAFAQWNAAHRLVERGAEVDFWSAAALGLVDLLETELASEPPDAMRVTRAFWAACHGGQKEAAALLLDHGADSSWQGWDDLTPLGAARRSEANDVIAWLTGIGAR